MTAHQAPPSLGFSRQEHWSGLPFPSNAWKWKVKVKLLSRVRLLVTPWTAAYQAPLSMGFSRQECYSGVPLLFSLWFPLFWVLNINGIMQYITFYVWLLSGFEVHPNVACVSASLFGWVMSHCMNIPYLVYLFIHWWMFELFLPFGCCE